MAAESGALTQFAPAKVNLYLHLCGQRDDGYHLLESLAVFPCVGDVLTAKVADDLSLSLSGPQASALDGEGDNLVLRAARLLAQSNGRPKGAKLHLEKNLPVASGIGGGSSDAAATLRLLSKLWSCRIPTDLVLRLGADIPVCLAAPEPTRMQGIGEVLTPVPSLPACAMVLVNPGIEVPTGAVFTGVSDKNPGAGPAMPERFSDFSDLIAWLKLQRNDLEAPACAICPEISEVLSGLSAAPLARMSGSGATCFALLPTLEAAHALKDQIKRNKSDWWVEAAALSGETVHKGG